MRRLFDSELRYIENVLRYRNGGTLAVVGEVETEYYSSPRNNAPTHFNTDYFLQFSNDLENGKSFCAPILPNTAGAEVFVMIDTRTRTLLRTDLVAGEAFPIELYDSFLDNIDLKLMALPRRFAIRECAYNRVFVINNEICFLSFPTESSPVVRGDKSLLNTGPDSMIAYYTDNAEVVCVDGWIRTSVAQSDWKLEAIPK
ncbi:MAG: hypothetical protein AABZ08_00795 [Planctomycetota bacterium]